jgi:hypothetical protein
MLLLITKIIIGAIWGITSLLMSSIFAAFLAPQKERILLRCFYTVLLLVPTLIIVPLSFAAFTLIIATGFSILLTVIGPRGIVELVLYGIPEMEEPDNLDPITKASAVERND